MSLLERRAAVLYRIWQDGPLELSELADLVPSPEVPLELAEHVVTLLNLGLIQMNAEPVDPVYGPSMLPWAEDQARLAYAELLGVRHCRVCGCSNNWACENGCWWVQDNLCSSCAEQELIDAAVGA